MPITTNYVGSNPTQMRCTNYLIQHYVIKLVSDFRQVDGFLRVLPVSSTNKTDPHDIAELFLKMALKTSYPRTLSNQRFKWENCACIFVITLHPSSSFVICMLITFSSFWLFSQNQLEPNLKEKLLWWLSTLYKIFVIKKFKPLFRCRNFEYSTI